MKPKTHSEARRKFLKTSALSVLGAAVVGIGNETKAKPTESEDRSKRFSLFREEHDRIDDIYNISPDYRRMDQKYTVLSRGAWDDKITPKLKSLIAKAHGMVPNPLSGNPGWTEPDHALAVAAWGGHDAGTGMSAFGQSSGGVLNNWKTHTTDLNRNKYKFKSKTEGSKYVKRAAGFLGADDVGIAPYDERWTYSKWYDGIPALLQTGDAGHFEAHFPFEPKSVISVVFEMDYDGLRCPGELNEAAVGLEYSHIAEVTHKIAVFLNKLGYKAIPAGNDVGLSIPIAIQAGMGELSRMGTVIHEKYGSRVRLGKVYTELELTPDKPITFGVTEFCKRCMKCADACPSHSISLETEPTMESKTGSISNHPGVRKWYHNNETCFKQWEVFGTGCGICIAVCPYNKLDSWVHHVAKIAVGVPIGRDIAREMDDMFGYGKMNDKNVKAFWNKTT